MEALLGFREIAGKVEDKSHSQKLVPWLSWDEWELIRASLFSNSPDSVAFALDRISAWRSRGCLPAAVEVTASIIKIQQKDPAFSSNLKSGVPEDEEVLAMLYSMAVMRLVNGLIEKTRRKTEVSIAEAAAKINMPRMLIDIRHEASHRDLPSLRLLRHASTEALDWLKSYYWDPQKKAIPFQGGETDNVREEVRSKLHELGLGLKMKQSLRLSSSEIKGKHSRKQIKRTVKSLIHLYAFFSLEVISILLELLLEVANPLTMVEFPDKFQVNLSFDAAMIAFEKWKPVITKLSKKEPEILLSLLNAVVDMIEARKAMKDDIGQENLSLSLYDAEICRISVLSSLFSWLVEIMKSLRSLYQDPERFNGGESSVLPKSILLELIRRCLLISEPGNSQLLDSALLLAAMFGNSRLKQKLNKLSLVVSSPCLDLPDDNNNPSAFDTERLVLQEKDIQQASKKVESLKRRRLSSGASQARSASMGSTSRWTVVESWKPCPIGMLPRTLGSSGRLPILDINNGQKKAVISFGSDQQKEILRSTGDEELREVMNLGKHENKEARNGSGKREASAELDESSHYLTKRARGDTDAYNNDAGNADDGEEDTSPDWCRGRLSINGVFQRVERRDLERIHSAIQTLEIPKDVRSGQELGVQNSKMEVPILKQCINHGF